MSEVTLAKLLEPRRTEFWGSVYDITPELIDKVFGDGGQLVQLFPINERPRYWIVRVDSTCSGSDDALLGVLDDIYDAIDDQFGCPSDEDYGIGDERPYFPMFDGSGTSWHFVK